MSDITNQNGPAFAQNGPPLPKETSGSVQPAEELSAAMAGVLGRKKGIAGKRGLRIILMELQDLVFQANAIVARGLPESPVPRLNSAYWLVEAALDMLATTGKAKVTVTYFGNEEPRVEVEGDVEVNLVDGEEDVWLFLKHQGVSIYSTEKDNGAWSDFWVSPYRGQDWNEDRAFDVRELPDIPAGFLARLEGLYPEDVYKQKMAYAIEVGIVTQNGRVK
jgi:hypothetical protein